MSLSLLQPGKINRRKKHLRAGIFISCQNRHGKHFLCITLDTQITSNLAMFQ